MANGKEKQGRKLSGEYAREGFKAEETFAGNRPRDGDAGGYAVRDTYHRMDEKPMPKRHATKRETQERRRLSGGFGVEAFDEKGGRKDAYLEKLPGMVNARQKKPGKRKGAGQADFLKETPVEVSPFLVTKEAKDLQKKLRKKEYVLKKAKDGKTGEEIYLLTTIKKDRQEPDRKKAALKKLYYKAENATKDAVQGADGQNDDENPAVEAASEAEEATSYIRQFGNRHTEPYKGRQNMRRQRTPGEGNAGYDTHTIFVNGGSIPDESRNPMKAYQKRRIKREYAQAAARAKRAGLQQSAREAESITEKAHTLTTVISRKIQELAKKYGALLAAMLGIFLVLIVVMTSVSSCSAMFSDGIGDIMGNSYQSLPAEIDKTAVKMSELEALLQIEINSIEEDYSDYDEYNYDLGEIGHDDFVLIGYLSAIHTVFTADEVEAEVEELFHEMYELTIEPTEETRERTVTDPDTGEETTEEYTVKILNVTLTVTPLETVVAGKMDDDQRTAYDALMESKGLLQEFYTPLDLYWYNYIMHGYGYMVNPETGGMEFNRGIDIAVPVGTNVYASIDGTVTETGYDDTYGNYVVMENGLGYCVKYAHLDTVHVEAGRLMEHGQFIGTTGETGSCTGSCLHIECLYNGEYYDPLFYFEAGEATLYGEGNAGNAVAGDVTPPGAYDDETVARLMAEASLYIGMPYVWGGSTPATSFDCSGFVCWVYTNSGVKKVPRTTAQGIYDMCVPISPGEAKAGDLIFFTGTYKSGTPVTHVGIYCGGGVMVHAGNPIKYASISTSYWQSHFYGFGRLP